MIQNCQRPDDFSPLGMYGNYDVFEKRLKQGYTEVSLGGGAWVGGERIVGICVFFHPDGRIATYEHPKRMMEEGITERRPPFEAEYTREKLSEHLQKFQIRLGKIVGLAEIVQKWLA